MNNNLVLVPVEEKKKIRPEVNMDFLNFADKVAIDIANDYAKEVSKAIGCKKGYDLIYSIEDLNDEGLSRNAIKMLKKILWYLGCRASLKILDSAFVNLEDYQIGYFIDSFVEEADDALMFIELEAGNLS